MIGKTGFSSGDLRRVLCFALLSPPSNSEFEGALHFHFVQDPENYTAGPDTMLILSGVYTPNILYFFFIAQMYLTICYLFSVLIV